MEENISVAYAPLLLYFFIEGKNLKIYVLSGSYPRQKKKTYSDVLLPCEIERLENNFMKDDNDQNKINLE